MISRSATAWLCLLCVVLPARDSNGQDVPTLLSGATVITATGEDPILNASLLIEDGTILYIGPKSEAPVDDEYELIDVSGMWITPGLIDTNVHLILNIIPEFYVRYENQLEDIAIQSAQTGLKYGMTTMADSWGPLDPLLAARDRINSGEFVASDVLIAGNIIGTGGPFSPYFMGGWDLHGKSLRFGEWVHPAIKDRINALWEAGVGPNMMALTANEAAAKMREYINRGVDFVKLGVSAHGITPVEPLMFSDEVIQAMAAEVKRAGLPLQTHTFTIESLRQGISIEPDLLQHPNVMSPSWLGASDKQKAEIRNLIDEIRELEIYSGLMAVPERSQIEIYKNWTSSDSDDPYLNEIMLYRQQGFKDVTYEMMSEGIKEWLNADIPYTIATDQGPETSDLGATVWGRLGRAHFDRMIGLQDAGAEPMEILISATRNGAAAYNLDDVKGTIEVGKVADLLVLRNNPLEDIGNLRSIAMIFKSGRLVDRDALPSIHVLDYDPELPWPY